MTIEELGNLLEDLLNELRNLNENLMVLNFENARERGNV
jgi:hypothetical protein